MIDHFFSGSYACFTYVLYPAVAYIEMFQKLSCLPCVWLCSCLCIVGSQCFRRSHSYHMCSILFLPVQSLLMHMFQKLSYLLCGLCLSSLTLPLTVKLFNISLCSQAPQQQYIVLSFSSMQRHCHSNKLTFSHARWYYTVGIPFSDT